MTLRNRCEDIKRVRADTFGYLQRSFPACRSEVDAWEARLVGQMAVSYSLDADQDGRFDKWADVVDDPNHPGFVVRAPVGGTTKPARHRALLTPWLALAAALTTSAAIFGTPLVVARLGGRLRRG